MILIPSWRGREAVRIVAVINRVKTGGGARRGGVWERENETRLGFWSQQ